MLLASKGRQRLHTSAIEQYRLYKLLCQMLRDAKISQTSVLSPMPKVSRRGDKKGFINNMESDKSQEASFAVEIEKREGTTAAEAREKNYEKSQGWCHGDVIF